jgi:hypothetical protein
MRLMWLTGALLILVTLAMFVPVGTTAAKGPVDRITIAAPSGALFEVTAGHELDTFNPWLSRYLSGEVDVEPDVSSALKVDFYLRDSDAEKRIYTFSYHKDAHGIGFIYLPGPADPDYRMNIGTILAPSDNSWHNGAWHRASGEWVQFIDSMTRVRPPQTGDAGLLQ